MNIKEEGNKKVDSIKYIKFGYIIKEGKNLIEFKGSKLLLSFKN